MLGPFVDHRMRARIQAVDRLIARPLPKARLKPTRMVL